MNFNGLGVALITPFNHDLTIDYGSLGKIVDKLMADNVDYIVVLGTTAETPTLMADERQEVLRFVAERVGGRLPLVAGMGGNNTVLLTTRLRQMDFTGYNAILSVVPFYNKPSQEGLYAHFAAVAEASPLPVILYNIPGRTGINMTADTTLRLAQDFENIAGIKEASDRPDQWKKIIENHGDNFAVISGDDASALNMIELGGNGVISVAANAFPADFAGMIHLALDGKPVEARTINNRFLPLYPLMFRDGNPAGIKAVLSLMNRIENRLRLPLVPASESTIAEIQKFLAKL